MNLVERMFGMGRDTGGAGAGAAETAGAEARRKADIARWWVYYHGTDQSSGRSQWDYLYERFPGMPRRELPDQENHTRICVDRLRRLLVNSWRGFEFGDSGAGEKVREVLERNRWPYLLNLAALSAKVTGDAFFRLVPAPGNSPFHPLRLVLLDSAAVTVRTDPHDRDDIREAVISYDFFDGEESNNKRHRYREEIGREETRVFVDDEPSNRYTHAAGVFPLVQVRNLDTGGDVYGESMVARLTEAQDALNLLSTDLMDIVRYDGHKTTIFQNVHIDKGASRDGRTAGEIDLSIGKGLVVKGEGRVYKLDQQHDLGAALQEYDRKLDAFYDLAGVPRISRELAGRFGSLSGRAVERLYQDAVESTREAQTLFGDSLCQLARKIALIIGIGEPGARAVWNTDVIIPDIDTLAREHEIGARSIRSVLRKRGIGDVEGMLTEIGEEGGK